MIYGVKGKLERGYEGGIGGYIGIKEKMEATVLGLRVRVWV